MEVAASCGGPERKYVPEPDRRHFHFRSSYFSISNKRVKFAPTCAKCWIFRRSGSYDLPVPRHCKDSARGFSSVVPARLRNESRRRNWLMVRRTLATLLILCAAMFAQDFRATLTGTVTDPSGATVP